MKHKLFNQPTVIEMNIRYEKEYKKFGKYELIPIKIIKVKRSCDKEAHIFERYE